MNKEQSQKKSIVFNFYNINGMLSGKKMTDIDKKNDIFLNKYITKI